MQKNKKIAIGSLLGIFIFWLACIHHTDGYHFGLTYNLFSGEVSPDKHQGYHMSAPWVLVSRIDTRPHRVCIPSAARNMDCRLVQFDTAHWRDLIATEGFHYYWWYNRVSFNYGQETYRGIENLLLGHAYGSTRCPCVKILQEVGGESK